MAVMKMVQKAVVRATRPRAPRVPAAAPTPVPPASEPSSRSAKVVVEPEEPGGVLNPVGWNRFAEGSHLLGLSCPCGRSVIVASKLFESAEPLACPGCGADLR